MIHDARQSFQSEKYHISVKLQDVESRILTEKVGLLRSAVRSCMARRPFLIETAVVLPSGVQMIWALPPGDHACGARWRQIQATFSRHADEPVGVCHATDQNREPRVWQRRICITRIESQVDLARCRALILAAPVRAGLVARPEEWPYSSIHRACAVPPEPVGRAMPEAVFGG
jgi:putative transposase